MVSCKTVKFKLWVIVEAESTVVQGCMHDSILGGGKAGRDGGCAASRSEGGWEQLDFLRGLLGLPSKRVYSPALHLAVMHGRLNNIRVLLTECTVDAEAFNLR